MTSLFPVVEAGKVTGCITTDQIKAVSTDKWPWHTVGEYAAPLGPDNAIGADEDALRALAQMNRNGSHRLLVLRDGALVGILALADLLKFLSLKMELEGGRKAA